MHNFHHPTKLSPFVDICENKSECLTSFNSNIVSLKFLKQPSFCLPNCICFVLKVKNSCWRHIQLSLPLSALIINQAVSHFRLVIFEVGQDELDTCQTVRLDFRYLWNENVNKSQKKFCSRRFMKNVCMWNLTLVTKLWNPISGILEDKAK